MILRRIGFAIFLGSCLALLAGYIGAVVMPSAMVLWLSGLLAALVSFNLKLLLMWIVTPAVFGAIYAWPVMLLALPLTACITRRAGAWEPIYCLLVGAAAGIARVYVMGQSDLVVPAVFTGAILGAAFGYGMWRFDMLQLASVKLAGGLRMPESWKLAVILGSLFVVSGIAMLLFLGTGPRQRPPTECQKLASHMTGPNGKILMKCNQDDLGRGNLDSGK